MPDTTTAARFVWWVPDGRDAAHAFPVGAGWMRSTCRDVRWSVKARQATNADRRCARCITATRDGGS